jgi:hypothetical protein
MRRLLYVSSALVGIVAAFCALIAFLASSDPTLDKPLSSAFWTMSGVAVGCMALHTWRDAYRLVLTSFLVGIVLVLGWAIAHFAANLKGVAILGIVGATLIVLSVVLHFRLQRGGPSAPNVLATMVPWSAVFEFEGVQAFFRGPQSPIAPGDCGELQIYLQNTWSAPRAFSMVRSREERHVSIVATELQVGLKPLEVGMLSVPIRVGADAPSKRLEVHLNPRCQGSEGRRVRLFRARDLKPEASTTEALVQVLLTAHLRIGGGVSVPFLVEYGAPALDLNGGTWTSLWSPGGSNGALGDNRPSMPAAQLIAPPPFRAQGPDPRPTPPVPPPPRARPKETPESRAAERAAIKRAWRKIGMGALALVVIGTVVGAGLVGVSSHVRSAHVPVYLLNGLTEPYVASVGKLRLKLEPGQALRLDLPEGMIELGVLGGSSTACDLKRTLHQRLFQTEVFVLNPDGAAILAKEWARYSAPPLNLGAPDGELVKPQPCHQFSEVDYFFEPFPLKFPIYNNQSVMKSRLVLVEQ